MQVVLSLPAARQAAGAAASRRYLGQVFSPWCFVEPPFGVLFVTARGRLGWLWEAKSTPVRIEKGRERCCHFTTGSGWFHERTGHAHCRRGTVAD